MLRVILVVNPEAEKRPAIAHALAPTPLTDVYAPPELAAAADEIGERHTLAATPEDRLLAGTSAIALIESVAESTEGTVAMLASPEVVREVVTHALDAPVLHERLALDPGAIVEIEVRLDAPWTVNRINDVCHLDASA